MATTAAAWFQWQTLELGGFLGLACALGQAPVGAKAVAGIKHLEWESRLLRFLGSVHPSALPGLGGSIPVQVWQAGFVALNWGLGCEYGLGGLRLVEFGNSRRKICSELGDFPGCPMAPSCVWG